MSLWKYKLQPRASFFLDNLKTKVKQLYLDKNQFLQFKILPNIVSAPSMLACTLRHAPNETMDGVLWDVLPDLSKLAT